MNVRTSLPATGLLLAALFAAPVRADDPTMAPGGAPPAPPAGADLPKGRFFDTYDANQDGKVTKDEFSGDPEVFVLLDVDKDGVVTLVELGLPADYRPRPMPKVEEGPSGKDEKRAGRFAERAEKFKQQLAEWDTDKDGKVTKEEYKGKIPFETLDRNKDGVINGDDLRAAGGPGTPGTPGMPGSPAEMAQRFKEADKNGDGKVTQDEFPGPAERFAMLDRNKDGAVTPDEMEAAMREGAGKAGGKRMFERFDKNGDGKVTRDEFPGGDDGFQKADKNGDGALTPDEMQAPGGGKAFKPGTPPGTPGTPPTTPAAPGGEATPPAGGGAFGGLFAALDKDHDGRLSRAEFPGSDDDWRRLDRDQNGWITPDEAK
ncbi:MAG: EF-hand domain-containing protein [Planctomycetes bacterium]|nr:EF-hand domain-containing protein [Planctomycetota bacterium]